MKYSKADKGPLMVSDESPVFNTVTSVFSPTHPLLPQDIRYVIHPVS